MRACLSVKSEKGSSLMSIVLAIGLMGIATLGILSWSTQKSHAGRQMNIHAVADQIKQRLVGAVISPNSWQLTQNYNTRAFADPVFSQGNGNGPAANSEAYPKLNLYIAGSSGIYYETNNPNAGFSPAGVPCTNFDAQNGNDACPFRYDIRLVRHVYQNGNWIDTVRFELTFKPASSKYILNSKKSQYTFDLVRNLDEKSVESSCIALNGQYNANTGECSVRITRATSCAQNSGAYRGPAANGGQSCETPRAASLACGTGQVIKGFDARGTPQCAAI